MEQQASPQRVPALVQDALASAAQLGFQHSSTPEVGQLLHVLAATIGSGVIGEIGTGCGVGAAWVVSAMQPGASFCTVEADAERAAAARRLLAPFPNVHVIEGDWEQILACGPFALLFVDTKAKQSAPDLIVDALQVGGMALLDDLTPEEYWPPEWHGREDPVRKFWLNHDRLRATEVRVTRNSAVILATRIG